MKILNFTFKTELEFSEPVREHDFVLRCLPTSNSVQTVLDSQAMVTPTTSIAQQTDGFGNKLLVGRIAKEHTGFSFISSGSVMVCDLAEATPALEYCHPIYLRTSEKCKPGAAIQALVADTLAGLTDATAAEKAAHLTSAVYAAMRYEKGATTVDTCAEEALAQGAGVCQDYAQILVAALRVAGIPSRYVSGLMLGEGATHAWCEAYDGRHWVGLDPTHDRLVNTDYIAIAHGRDFADCPVESGILTGGARQAQHVRVRVVDDAPWVGNPHLGAEEVL